MFSTSAKRLTVYVCGAFVWWCMSSTFPKYVTVQSVVVIFILLLFFCLFLFWRFFARCTCFLYDCDLYSVYICIFVCRCSLSNLMVVRFSYQHNQNQNKKNKKKSLKLHLKHFIAMTTSFSSAHIFDHLQFIWEIFESNDFIL